MNRAVRREKEWSKRSLVSIPDVPKSEVVLFVISPIGYCNCLAVENSSAQSCLYEITISFRFQI